MRPAILLQFLSLLVFVATACSGSREPSTPAAINDNQAAWADHDAQGRIADGDYEGAVKAAQYAAVARRRAAAQAHQQEHRQD
jgi:hypothetical protein